jgi:ComF family protein
MVRLRRGAAWLLAQLLPPACPLCKVTFPDNWSEPFCAHCLADILPLPAAQCSCCALPFKAKENSAHLCGRCLEKPPPFNKVYAAGLYQNSLRDAIHHFKFNNRIGLDRPFGLLLNRSLPNRPDHDLIVPVPLSSRRLRQRSYNQALLLARELARCRSLPVAADLLEKTTETVSQQELSAKERERNLKQAFQVQRPLHGSNVLLVDDVLTTGATARACCKVLLDAGAGMVDGAVLARA